MPGIHGSLGIAKANERGYSPVPLGWARYATQDEAQDHADKLNASRGLSSEEAWKIVASTMGGLRYHRPA